MTARRDLETRGGDGDAHTIGRRGGPEAQSVPFSSEETAPDSGQFNNQDREPVSLHAPRGGRPVGRYEWDNFST